MSKCTYQSNAKQRWQILSGNTSNNKENQTVNKLATIVKPIKKYPPIVMEKKKLIPSRTITQYFKIANIKKYPNVSFMDENGISQEFQCYDDKLLSFPCQSNQTISHNVDNDCQTDDEQIASAIRTLHRLMEQSTNSQE